jgi:uridine kinase
LANNTHNHKPLLVGIAGGSASGKSTFVRILTEQIAATAPALAIQTISSDRYFHRDRSKIPLYKSQAFLTDLPDFNHPDALDIAQLVADLDVVLEEKSPPDVVLLEGHLLFHYEVLRERMDVRIFVDLDGETRALRRMVRNLAHPGDPIPDHSAQSIASYYLESAREGYRRFIEPTRQFADLIINGDGEFQRTAALVAPIIIANVKKDESVP